ncbi:DUF2752 domain-containing protein [Actinocorallia longicatena]|uniref:DUF2752 domain-containing protein n=1 Tax=Actinocorallia longicatena TaxID=111803 RepID=A0ABP6QK28_9ACTN
MGVRSVRASRWRGLIAPLGLGAAAAAAFAYVGSVDPNEAGHYPTCPFLATTGLLCPGCGGLRMTHAIAHGQFGEAASKNLLAFVMIPVVLYLWGLWVVAAWRGTEVRTRLSHRWLIMGFVGTIAVFWVLRNLPFGGFLAP